MDIKDKRKLVDDIEALIYISDNLARSFDFKVKELREMYQDEINQYNEIRELMEGKTLDIKFEMEYIKNDWTVSAQGLPDFDTGTIPEEIIQHIMNNASSTGIIKMIKDFKTGDGRKFDISFEKLSKNCISGNITEKREEFLPYNDNQNTSKPGEKSKMKKFKELFMFLKNDDEFGDWMLSQFHNNWKPLFETGCIQPLEKS
jgi:hypothetical protein